MKKGSAEHLCLQASPRRCAAHEQSREEWGVRVIRMQLLYPEEFKFALTLGMSNQPARRATAHQFTRWAELGILKSIDFSMMTPYRITLFLRAARSYVRQCERIRRHGPESTNPNQEAQKEDR